MSVATIPQAAVLPTDYQPRTRRWSRDEYYRAYEIGLFGPTEKLELIRGEIKVKMPQRPRHFSGVRRLERTLSQFEAPAFHLRSQGPISLLNDSEPEPDIVVARGTLETFETHHPTADEVILVVEVSDTTLLYDRTDKAALYAEAGIPEYWILNGAGGYLEVRRDPEEGEYRSLQTLRAGASVSPLFAPETTIEVADLLPLEA